MIQQIDRSIVILCAGLSLGCANGEPDQGWTSFGQTSVADEEEDEDDDDDDDDDEVGESSTDDDDDTTETETDTTTETETDTTTDTGDDCGNGVVDLGEDCDGLNFAGLSCMGLGFSGGFLICTDSCLVDSSNCIEGEGGDDDGGGGGQPEQGLYSDCLLPEDCVGADGCATVANEDEVDPFDGYCTNFCGSDAECDLGLEGTAIPVCNSEIDPYCELICTGGLTCPAPMQCVQLTGKMVCY